jgi:hypothetical protein
MAELAPQGELEEFLADRVVESAWRLRRAGRMERQIVQDKFFGELRSRVKNPGYHGGSAGAPGGQCGRERSVQQGHVSAGQCAPADFCFAAKRAVAPGRGPDEAGDGDGRGNAECRIANAQAEKSPYGENDSAKRSQFCADALVAEGEPESPRAGAAEESPGLDSAVSEEQARTCENCAAKHGPRDEKAGSTPNAQSGEEGPDGESDPAKGSQFCEPSSGRPNRESPCLTPTTGSLRHDAGMERDQLG